MQLYCGPSPHISYIGFPKISQDFLRFPRISSILYTAFPYTAFLAAFLYIRHSHGIPGGMHSYGMLRHLYSMHAYNIRHACPYTTFLRQKKTWWLSVCLRTTCLRHAYDRHAYDMHIYGMPTTCLYIRHAYTTCMPIYDMPIYDMPIYTTCLRHAYDMPIHDMPTTCLRHAYTACLRHAYDMHAYMASLYDMHAYDMPI